MAAIRQQSVLGVESEQDSRVSVSVGFEMRAYPPDTVCRDDSWAVIRYARRAAYVTCSWNLAVLIYVRPAIIKHAGKDFMELVKGILPGLLIAFGIVVSTTLIGAAIGGLAGGVFGVGAGAAPGAAYGGGLGLTVGMWLLDFLGVYVLAKYVLNSLNEVGQYMAQGIKEAWNSCGSTEPIDAAARSMAEALGYFFDVLMQGLVAYIAEEGMAKALGELNKSKIGGSLDEFLRTETFKKETISYWLDKLGKPNEPMLVRERVGVVVEFVRDKAKGRSGMKFGGKQIREVLDGTDFNTPVASPKDILETFETDNVLVQRPDSKYGGGNWFTKSGYSANSTGLAEGDRGFRLYKVLKPFEALKTRSASINDTFTSGQAVAGRPISGGGMQYFAEKHVNDLLTEGYIEELYMRRGPRIMTTHSK
jgi:hypothetical protein